MAVPPAAGARPALAPGDVLAGRYRLVQQVGAGAGAGPATLWRADDAVLGRVVAVRIVPADGDWAAAADRFLDAAAEAGAVDLPVLARIYDAALEERPAGARPAAQRGRRAGGLDIGYVVREWVDGRPLDRALRRDGPLEPDAARTAVAAVARGLAAARERGLVHGRLHPGNVVVTPDGRLKVLDLAVAAALAGEVPADRADTRDLGALLYALLTATWPRSATGQPAGSLPAAPVRDGRPQRPARVRRGVPADLDQLVVAVLTGSPGAPATPEALAAALERLAPAAPAGARRPRLPAGLRRRTPALLVAAFLLVVGATSFVAGRQIGGVQAEQDGLEALGEPSPGAPPGDGSDGGGPVDLLGTATVTDFDPPPGDGREMPGAVPNAFDGDPTTAWETERYSSAQLGGLKRGVGLLVDLGAPVPIARVEVGVAPGTVVELRASDEAGASLDAFPVVATDSGRQDIVRIEAGRTARYWLVVLTELPPGDGGFRGSVREMLFVRG